MEERIENLVPDSIILQTRKKPSKEKGISISEFFDQIDTSNFGEEIMKNWTELNKEAKGEMGMIVDEFCHPAMKLQPHRFIHHYKVNPTSNELELEYVTDNVKKVSVLSL